MNHYHNKKQHDKGFTLIELMLAMTFLSMLLLAIAMTTMQISSIYTKGVTLREVNQVGRTIVDDFQRTIESSAPFDVTSSSVLRRQANGGGQLCLGTYSYVWNSPTSLASNAAGMSVYSDGTPVHLARVSDKTFRYCTAASVPVVDRGQSVELLTSGARTLVLRDFSIIAGASDLSSGQGQQLYALTFGIGTNTGDEQSVSSVSACKIPGASGDGGMQNYCSVNKFDITVLAGGDSSKKGN